MKCVLLLDQNNVDGLLFPLQKPLESILQGMIAHVQCCNGNQVPMQQSFTTFSTFLEMRATLLQPLVGRFSVRNFKTGGPTPG